MDKASFLGAKQKEKEAALEKAQVAESSLEELKEKFRELRRQEENMLREVEAAPILTLAPTTTPTQP